MRSDARPRDAIGAQRFRAAREAVADHDIHDEHDIHDVHDGQDDSDDSDTDDDDEDSDEDGDGDTDDEPTPRFGPNRARSRFTHELIQPTDGPSPPEVQLGVIGCGEIAQILHLPHLSSLDGATIAAIADRSAERLERVGRRYGISHRYQRGETLLSEHRTDLDGVVITTPPHTHEELVSHALEVELATFVESPLAIVPAAADDLREQAAGAAVPAMVGYLGRYDPAYTQFSALLEQSTAVRYVDALHVDPVDPRILRDVYDIVPGPLPVHVAAEAPRIRSQRSKDALGIDADWIAEEYLYHLGQACRDVNRLRGLYDDVVHIHHAALDGPGEFLTAEIEYANGNRCHLTSGWTNGEWSEEYVRVNTAEGTVHIDCADPYHHGPSSVTVKDGTDEVVTRTHVPTTEPPVKRELRAFLDAIRNGTPTKTPFADAARDVELVAELVARATSGTGGAS